MITSSNFSAKLYLMVARVWGWLRGPKTQFILENRILNSGGILSIATLTIFAFYNVYIVYIPELAVATAVTLVIQYLLYYQSRFKRRFTFARTGFTMGSYVFLAINYYYSSGINGPVIFSFFVTLTIIVVIHKHRQYIYLLLHFFIVIFLLWFEYTYGIINIYDHPSERFLDIGCVFCIMSIINYVIVKGVLDSYNIERNLANDRAEQLVILHKENTRLFSIISHDLRTPLSAIQSYLELLTYKQLEQTERVMLESKLFELTKGTSDFLDNLLYWSKSQLEGMKIRLASIEIMPILEDVMVLLAPVAAKKSVTFKLEIDSYKLTSDKDMLRIIIRNLLSNAIKYSHSGGEIIIISNSTNREFILSVKDFGMGITQEKQDSIFSSQVKSSPGTLNEIGVGLGLLLCYDFVKALNGRIWFESKPQQATVFYIAFPMDR